MLFLVRVYLQNSLTEWNNSVNQMVQQKTLDQFLLNGYDLLSSKFAAYFVECLSVCPSVCLRRKYIGAL